MRFIFNFIFFGLLFYIIWLYFPEAFTTLVSWATKTFDFFKNLIQGLVEKVNSPKEPSSVGQEGQKAAFFAMIFF